MPVEIGKEISFETKCFECLGVYIDKNSTFRVHFKCTCIKTAKRCGFLENFRSKLNVNLSYFIVLCMSNL